jgi:hypothetical protein
VDTKAVFCPDWKLGGGFVLLRLRGILIAVSRLGDQWLVTLRQHPASSGQAGDVWQVDPKGLDKQEQKSLNICD